MIVLDERGRGRYGPPGTKDYFPADALVGSGIVNGRTVDCITPEWLVRFHRGYEVDTTDWADVSALCARFGIPVPREYLQFTDEGRLLAYFPVDYVEEIRLRRHDIARAYAAARTLTDERVRVWASFLRRELQGCDIRTIVDLGCGVGRFTQLLRQVFDARVYGIDPSQRMLAIAIASPDAHLVAWLRASAETLPIGKGTIDLVFLYLVYHHLRDPLTALRECARVLSSSGHVLVVNATVEILDSLRWLPFFPSARQIDSARLPIGRRCPRLRQMRG